MPRVSAVSAVYRSVNPVCRRFYFVVDCGAVGSDFDLSGLPVLGYAVWRKSDDAGLGLHWRCYVEFESPMRLNRFKDSVAGLKDAAVEFVASSDRDAVRASIMAIDDVDFVDGPLECGAWEPTCSVRRRNGKFVAFKRHRKVG